MFDDVSFRYGPNLAGVFDLSFVVAAGKTVAFVGPSGSGKSTTARLACRLYDVAGGSVRVGGIDIRGVKQASLRRLTAVVAQETVLFNESVAFNIGYGLEGDDRERVVQAAKRAQLHDRVISCRRPSSTRRRRRGTPPGGRPGFDPPFRARHRVTPRRRATVWPARPTRTRSARRRRRSRWAPLRFEFVCVHADTRDGLGRYPSAWGRVETIETIELFIAAS